MLKARDIVHIPYNDSILDDTILLQSIREQMIAGDVVIMKNVLNANLIHAIKTYLSNLGRYSMPNYQPILEGTINHHRVNVWDERAYIKGCFHQFSFFPWNQDVFNFFQITQNIFFLKNLINNQPKDKFIKPENGCTVRLSFQFYPKGMGCMNKHSDPVDHHQLIVPSLVMSKRGVDYDSGGVYVEGQNDEPIFVEDDCEIGDVVLFNAQIPHGVKVIDEHKEANWLSFEGRWMMIFATNKFATNQAVANAKDFEASAL